MALCAKSPGEHLQHLGVLRSMRVMALQASFTSQTFGGIVLVDEWPGDLCVAGYARLAIRRHAYRVSLVRRPRVGVRLGACTLWVDEMAVAAHHASFGHGMVEVLPELVDLTLVAGAAQRGLIGF